ncbi:MAG TPA: hypothetical protein VGR26_15595 [Acidimicrobiales bacterium]|nr:hypothetical protein [Acidimicrobiales bacterium]
MVIVGNAVAGSWALGAHWVPRLRIRALWWLTVLVEVAIFMQVALGVAMIAVESRDADEFHMFYGFVAIIAVGILYSYRAQLEGHRYLLYGLGGLFLMGLGIRALLLDA